MGLKYKVYDKVNDKMYSMDKYNIDIELNNEMVRINNCPYDLEDEVEAVMLPYTGVNDINKKESYLGDILKEQKPTYGYDPSKDNKKAFYIVKKELHNNNMYLEYNFNIRGYWEKNNLQLCRIEGLEVIGNIYENQDMINKE